MNQISGTYKNGKVLLDRPVDWPNGAHVSVVREERSDRAEADVCVDGSIWEDTPQARQAWLAWFDSLQPVFTGEQLARFEADLRAIRQEQKSFLPAWEERTCCQVRRLSDKLRGKVSRKEPQGKEPRNLTTDFTDFTDGTSLPTGRAE